MPLKPNASIATSEVEPPATSPVYPIHSTHTSLQKSGAHTARAQDKVNNQKYHLLVVDDNDINRDLMALQLRRQGYQTTTASGGLEALGLLENNSYDLILLDIMMPGMNGLDMLVEVRKKHSMLSLPVIMVTADDLQESVIDALKRGANDYLIKPLNIPVTIARVKTQLTTAELASLKDEFVRFASHDLKKPLIVSLDIVEALQNDCRAGEMVKEDTPELLDLLHKTGENMQRVIEGFLNTETLQSGTAESKCQLTKINQLVQKSIQNNAEYARKKGVELKQEFAGNLPDVDVDAFQITQVMDNLIGNAMKFSPRETTTTVRTYCDDKYVYAEVCDGGPGLTDDDLGKLFQRHARLSNRPTGDESSTGIGLALSKQLVEQHQGLIGARNNPNHGATFWIALPVV
ncbi:hybrid sensor histidine kinase/response regulator [Kaarinaea lacus]